MIAKKELFNVPIWGHAMQASGFIAIDRDNREQAIKDLEQAKEQMRKGIIPGSHQKELAAVPRIRKI